jgi:uroporphyrinogen III methyltransferase/synthase
VFGRGGEEALALRRAGIPFGIVPGVTAGVAGPAHAGIPLTQRGLASSVAFVTASNADATTPDRQASADALDWSALAQIDTLVVFMAGRAASAVGDRLLEAGRDPGMPVAVVIAASRPDQEVHRIDLVTLAATGLGDAASRLAGRPVLLVIGRVAALADELAWFEPDAWDLDEPAADGWAAREPGDTLPVAV